ncbi:hypothetical protein MOQ_007039, partial [Trypanosoma cruzi marinkellei]
RVYMRWSLVCRSCLLLPPPSVCWCCGVRCMPGCRPLLMCVLPSVCVSAFTSRLPCCSPCPSLCRSAPHHRTTTLTMMRNCRLLCALLVLALCCCPNVCVTEDGGKEKGAAGDPPTQKEPGTGATSLNPDNNTNLEPVASGVPGRLGLAAAAESSGERSTTQDTIVAPGHSGSLVCVLPSVRGADTTDRSRRVYMRWSLVCRSCLLLPPPSVCWCCGVRCMPGCRPLLMCVLPSVCVSAFTSRLPCCSPCPSLCRSAPHHRTTTLTMMRNCRLLCALLVLALCCCPNVCVTEDGGKEKGAAGDPPTQKEPGTGATSLNPDNNTNLEPVASGVPGRLGLAAAAESSGERSTTQDTIVAPGHSGSGSGETIPPGSTDKSHESVV